jgi:hypothetical protein
LVACISFTAKVRSGRKLLPGAIVIAKAIAIKRRCTNSHFVVDASAETAGAD